MVLLGSGCGHDVSSPPPAPATIALSAASTTPFVSAGETRSVTAIARDANGSVIRLPSVVWRTSTPAVATVTGSGDGATITAVDDGTAVISAASGMVEGTLTVTVRRRVVVIELSVPDSVVVAGTTAQLTVVGRDARQQEVRELRDVRFTTSNPFSVLVSPTGLVIALFSPFQPRNSIVTATVTRDGVTLSAAKRIEVGSPAPPVFDLAALMLPESVRPEPVLGIGQGIIYLTLDGARVQYRMLWSFLTGPATSAHIHGPDPDDGVAPVLVELPLGTQTTSHGVLTGSFSASDIRSPDGRPAISLDSLIALLKTPAAAYVDMHTSLFGDGEMRGPIVRFH